MKIGIDLDQTISYAPEFFALLTQMTVGHAEVYVITNRRPGSEEEVAEEVRGFGVRFDHICITGEKSDFILKNGIEVYFDDTDEYFQSLPESVKVFKTREPGNFCFNSGRWFYADTTGINFSASK